MRKLLVTAGLIASVGMGTLPLSRAQAAGTPPPRPNGSFSDAAAVATPVPSYNRASAVSGSAIVQYALKFLGYPYTATGNSPSTGFSCIGFVSYVYRSMGINLPGDLGGALAFAPRVAFSSLLPGDILYFQNTVWAGLSHAAIYLGGGRFVHAEWYNRGVVTSSFTNDPVDGNYWTAHYLGANRPWTGTSGVAPTASIVQRTAVTRTTATVRATVSLETAPTPVPTTVIVPTTSSAPARASVQLPAGPIALVRVPSLNVRSGPSIRATIYTVIRRGTKLVVLGQQSGWYRVALPNGATGWVIGLGIGKGAGSGNGSGYAPGPDQHDHIILSTPAPTATARPTPLRVVTRRHVTVSRAHLTRETAIVRVPELRVHAGPALTARVLGVATPRRSLTVLGQTLQWVKVRLPNGTVGWISRHYAQLPATRSKSSTRKAGVRSAGVTSRARVALNVRATSALSSAIAGVVVPGGAYRILHWSHGWAHVLLATGVTGWISGSVLTRAFTTSEVARTSGSSSAVARRSSVTASVRLHVSPSLNSAAIRLLAAGTRVQVLNAAAGWSEVRISSHQIGYVLGTYVKK
jgi:uncharacterized protein YgiM (DUF1202 family)